MTRKYLSSKLLSGAPDLFMHLFFRPLQENTLRVLKLNTCRMEASCVPCQAGNPGVILDSSLFLSSPAPQIHSSPALSSMGAKHLVRPFHHDGSSFDSCNSLQCFFFSLVLHFLYRAILVNVNGASPQTYWGVSAWTGE